MWNPDIGCFVQPGLGENQGRLPGGGDSLSFIVKTVQKNWLQGEQGRSSRGKVGSRNTGFDVGTQSMKQRGAKVRQRGRQGPDRSGRCRSG